MDRPYFPDPCLDYGTTCYRMHEIGLSLHPGASNFIRYEDRRGHPLDWAGCPARGYALCCTQKITTKNLIPHVPCIPAFPGNWLYIQHQKLFPQHTPTPCKLTHVGFELCIANTPQHLFTQNTPPPILFLQKRVHFAPIGATNRYP